MIYASKKNCIVNLSVYSVVHALIDASCAAIIAADISLGKADLGSISFYVVLYNIIAFAFQAPLGFMADRMKKPAETAAIGCLLVLTGVLSYRTVSFALVIAGLGNALYHLGGGITVLNLRPGKAALPGIYVSTGAVGLLIGTLAGKSAYFSVLPFAALLIAASVIIFCIKRSHINYNFKAEVNFYKFNIILISIFASIAIRSLVGFMLAYPWKSDTFLLIAFTVAVASGKAFGGILGDRFGWRRVTICSLLISAPLLVLGMNMPLLAILGVFLFNMTMPVTLTAIFDILPGYSGFAFGLTTLALIIGAFPTFTELKSMLCKNNGVIIFGIVIVMALLINVGLKALSLHTNRNFKLGGCENESVKR